MFLGMYNVYIQLYMYMYIHSKRLSLDRFEFSASPRPYDTLLKTKARIITSNLDIYNSLCILNA